MAPSTAAGAWAVGLFALGVLLLIARMLAPLLGLPLNFLVALIPIALAGVTSLYAVGRERERSVAVFITLGVGVLVALFLLAELVSPGV